MVRLLIGAPRGRRAKGLGLTCGMSKKVTYAEIVLYLTELGVSDAKIKACPQQWADLQALAVAAGGDLSRKADVKAASERKRAATKESLAARRKMSQLKPKEIERLRLAFDHFDADASGKLDIDEFRLAMIDCGMMPLGFEVQELFEEADEDGSKDVDFDEYCRFVQLYKAKQNVCEKAMEAMMDCLAPQPAYLSDPMGKFLLKMHGEGCSAAAIAAFRYNYTKLTSGEDLNLPEIDISPVDELPALEHLQVKEDPSLLRRTVMLKLNGGLGTGMGLEKAKSLLPLKGENNFLDFIAQQAAGEVAVGEVGVAILGMPCCLLLSTWYLPLTTDILHL